MKEAKLYSDRAVEVQRAWKRAEREFAQMSKDQKISTLVKAGILTEGSHRVRKQFSRVIQADSQVRKAG